VFCRATEPPYFTPRSGKPQGARAYQLARLPARSRSDRPHPVRPASTTTRHQHRGRRENQPAAPQTHTPSDHPLAGHDTLRSKAQLSMPKARADFITNQVFIGLPWKNVKSKYEAAVDHLRKKYPLSFIIIGREDSQDAEDLLAVIKGRIQSSSYAIFDATDGNANVSLEYGYAEAMDVPRALYRSSRKHTEDRRLDKPIISDLAGKRRNEYKTQNALVALLSRFCEEHAYSKRFERFLATASPRASRFQKKSNRALALKIIHSIDGTAEVRREDVVQELLAEQSAYERDVVDSMIRKLHKAKLILSMQGPHSTLSIRNG